ncbi:MAG: hypothetical protein KDB90_06455 [Planctomycetes bacterium]|nr:hypothetical protein [Planctomycetota bacterium]
MRGTGQMGGGLVTWWMDRPWWLRWIICFASAALCLVTWYAVGITLLLLLLNLYLSWNEILDRFLPRK